MRFGEKTLNFPGINRMYLQSAEGLSIIYAYDYVQLRTASHIFNIFAENTLERA